mgnify:CR=1 FL=1
MLTAQRRRQIKALLLEHKSVTVSSLARHFTVTDETIRRDLTALEGEGVLQRTYGGAFIQDGVENVIDSELRMTAYVDNKREIASLCHGLIQNGDTLFLDNSTTSFFIAKELRGMRVAVMTNNLSIMKLLSKDENIKLVSLGGEFSIAEQSFYGSITVDTLQQYYVDKSFISCRTLSMENGITESTDAWAEIRRLAIKRSNKSYLVADHTKFDRTSFASIGNYNELNAVITDKPLSQEWHEFLTNSGCEVMEAEPSIKLRSDINSDLIG